MGKCSWVAFESGAKSVLTFVFSHIGLCALVMAYSLAGKISTTLSLSQLSPNLISFAAEIGLGVVVDEV